VPRRIKALRLARASRMLVDGKFVFLNGESWRMGGAEARLLRKLAHARQLSATDLIAENADFMQVDSDFQSILRDWVAQGWLHAD